MFNYKYLFSSCYVLDTVLRAGNVSVNKRQKSLASDYIFYWWRGPISKKKTRC